MKLLADLKRLTAIMSGRFTTVVTDLPDADFKLLMEHVVFEAITAQYPEVLEQQIAVSSNPHTFTGSNIPDWIYRVDPVGVLSPSTPLSFFFRGSRGLLGDVIKPTFFWEYEKPILYLEYTGDVMVKGCHGLTLTADNGDWDIGRLDPTIKPVLIKLATGHVMVSVGSDERNIKLGELPIELAGEAMVGEGTEKINEAMEELKELNKWWLSAG